MTKRQKIEYDADKLRELTLHISRRSEGDPCFGAVKLNKILFYADFLAYRQFGRPITGAEYQKLDHGPAPRQLRPLRDRMEREGALAVRKTKFGGYAQHRTLALREPILGKFTAEEIALVDELIQELWGDNASEVSARSHRFVGWQLAKLGETIPYGVALLNRRDPTEKERHHGLRLEEAATAALAAGQMAATHRTVVESKQYTKELKRIESNPIAADDLVDGAKWVLSRDPYRGVQLGPRSLVWFLAIDPPRAKSVGLYYAFDDHTVHFLSITQL